MYERMLNKEAQPEIQEIRRYIGEAGWSFTERFEEMMNVRYDLRRELRFPFGNSYGWGYKYSHKTKHLCYLFFEKDAVTIMTQIGDREVPALNALLPTLPETARILWQKRYPCGNEGGWINYRILTEEDLETVIRFIEVKKKPLHKV